MLNKPLYSFPKYFGFDFSYGNRSEKDISKKIAELEAEFIYLVYFYTIPLGMDRISPKNYIYREL